MTKITILIRIRLLLLVLVFASTQAMATNGYFTHGLGTKNKGMAGAGTAKPNEAIAASVNPAAAVLIGERFEAGISVFSPRRSYSATASQVNGNFGAFTLGPTSVDSDSEFFPIPYIGKIWTLDETSALGVSFYGRGGMNTDYSGGTATFDPDGPGPAPVMTLNGVFGGGSAGVNLSQAFVDVSWAVQKGDLSLGIAGVVAIQAFEARGLGAFAGFTKTFVGSGFTQMPAKLTNNGHDMSYGWGLKLGLVWQASETVSLAWSYQSKASMSDFDDYSDLFAEGGGFDIPSAMRLGISWQRSPSLGVHFDIEEINYTDVDSVSNSINNLFNCPSVGGTDVESCLGGKRGGGFAWDDMTVYKLGFDWTASSMPGYAFRAGYSHTNQPISSDQVMFNILAPGVIEDHITFGITKQMADNEEFNISVMYAFSETVSGPGSFDSTQQLEIEMDQWEVEFGYSW